MPAISDDPSGELLVDAIHARYERRIHETERGRQGHVHEHEHETETLWIQSPTVVMLLGAVACEFSALGLGDGKARQNKRASLRELLSTAALGGSRAGMISSVNSTIGVISTTSTARTTSVLSPALQEIVLLAFVALLRDEGEGEDMERIRKDVESLAKGAQGYIKRVSF